MPAKKISFGPIEFAKKEDAANYLRDILSSYEVGDKVSDAHGQILLDALAHHPDFASKIGNGVQSFSVRSADFGTKCFWINRTDGTTEKFAVNSCVYSPRKKPA